MSVAGLPASCRPLVPIYSSEAQVTIREWARVGKSGQEVCLETEIKNMTRIEFNKFYTSNNV